MDYIVITVIVWGDVINEVWLNNNIVLSGILSVIAVGFLCHIVYKLVRGKK